MLRSFIYFLIIIIVSYSMPAQAQTLSDKTGWGHQGAPRLKIESEKKAEYEVEYKVGFEFETHVSFKNSNNAETCALKASSPVARDVLFCKAALAESDLSAKNRYSAAYNLAIMYIALGEADLASSSFAAAIALSPESAASYMALAKLETKRGNDDAAMQYAKLALDKGTEQPSLAHVIIGYLYEREFDFDKAREAYSAALFSNIASGQARQRLDRVNRLWPAK